jgi:hypothetical protein
MRESEIISHKRLFFYAYNSSGVHIVENGTTGNPLAYCLCGGNIKMKYTYKNAIKKRASALNKAALGAQCFAWP